MRRLGRLFVVLALVFMGLAAAAPKPASAAPSSSGGPPPGAPGQEEIRRQHQQEYADTHKDSSGNLRPDLERQGISQQQQMETTNMQGQRMPAPGKVGPKSAFGVVGATWTQIGPGPVRIEGNGTDPESSQGVGPDSGEVTDIAIDPSGTTDRIVYIATNDGGIWKTTNGDAPPGDVRWSPLTDNMPSNSMGAVALDPTNPSIVYAGTGNGFSNLAVGPTFPTFNGIGLYRSTDGGATWAQPAGNSVFVNRTIFRIVVPAANVVLVASNVGLFKSVDGGTTYGKYPAFNDSNPVLGGIITDLHIGNEGASTIYASTSAGTLHRSTDTGTNFTGTLFDANVAGAANGFVTFSQATGDNKIIYASVKYPNAANPSPPPATRGDGRIFRTTNADVTNPTWANVPAGSANAFGCQCGYDQTIAVDPQDDKTVYTGFQELYVTSDAGANWPKVSRGKIHWDHHALVFSPPSHRTGAPTRAWQGHDGGVSYTNDRGNTFALPDEGIATNLFYGIGTGTGDPVNRGYAYGGTQDQGTLHKTNTTPPIEWHETYNGDGGPVAVDHCNAKHAMGSSNGFFISTPDITTTKFNQTNNGFGTNATPTATGVDVMAFDINCGSNRAYVGDTSGGLWRSTDNGANFTKLNPPFPSRIRAMSMIVGSSDIMWVGLADGTTQRTSNLTAATPTWTPHSVFNSPANQSIGYPGGIAMDPTDATGNTVVVTYEGFTNTGPTVASRHVFRTTDGGTNWTDISGTDGAAADVLPDLPTHSVVIDPDTTPHGIIVSNDAGVLRTSDNGASWQRLGTGLPTVLATHLQIDTGATPTLLRLGTYGRSAFELTGNARADLQMGKTAAPSPVNAGTDLTYTLTVKNNGPNDAQSVSMTDTLVGPSTYKSETHPAGWTCTAPTVGSTGVYNCTRPTLTVADNTQTFTVVVHVPANTPDGTTQANSAAVSSGTLDADRTNNVATSSTLIQARADLETIKTAPAGPVAPTTNMTYNIKVTNKGPSDAQSVSVSDALPAGMAFISETHPAGWNCTKPAVGAGGTVTCTEPTMAAAAVANFTITVHISPTVPSGTDVPNTATASSTTTDPDLSNNSSTAVTRVACVNTLTGNFPSSLNLSGGSWCLNNANVGSAVIVSPGTLVIIINSTLRSDLNANGSNNLAVCNTTVRGSLNVTDAAGFVLIGDPGDDLCPGNALSSSVRLDSNHAGVELGANSRIMGSVMVRGNSGVGPFPDDSRPEIEANNIFGALVCSGNTPTATNDGQPNTVRGGRTGECATAGF